MIALALLLTVMTAVLCSANPLGSTTIVFPEVKFAGSPTACRIPNSTFCGVDYNVPDIIATMVHLIEDGIQGELVVHQIDDMVSGQEPSPCLSTIKAILCAQNFPKCEGYNVVLTSTQNCENDIEDNCDASTGERILNNHFCSLADEVVPLESCSAISTFTNAQNQLREAHCGQIESSTRVSEWMFRFIQFADLKVSATLAELSLNGVGPTCSPNYARYFCQFLGECNEDSTTITVKNDYHFCEQTLNCYDNSFAETLRPLFPCDRWLSLDYPSPVTSSPSVESPTNGPASVSTLAIGPSVSSIKPNPLTLPLPANGAHTLHSAGRLLFCLTVLVTLVTLL